jgi:hypothetical protein
MPWASFPAVLLQQAVSVTVALMTKIAAGMAALALALALPREARQLLSPCTECKVQLRLALEKSTYEIGEPIPVQLHVTNVGPQPIEMSSSSERSGRHDGFAFEVRNATGQNVPAPAVGSSSLLKSIGGFKTLPPGATDTREILLNYHMAPLSPGSYTMKGLFAPIRLQIRAQSTTLRFQIAPTTETRVKARVADLVRQSSTDARSAAVRLGFTGHVDAIQPLVDMMYQADDGIAATASDALLNFKPSDVVRQMTAAVRSRGPSSRLVWLLLVGLKANPETVIPSLVSALEHREASVRASAVEGLRLANGQRPDPKLFAPLAKRLADSNAAVRHQAVIAVGGYQNAAALAALKNTVDDVDPAVREQTMIALGWITAASDPNSPIREEIAEIHRRVAASGQGQRGR